MTSIGTLFAFVVVCRWPSSSCASKRPDARSAVQGAVRHDHSRSSACVSCAYLMVSLTVMTWVRFLVWLDLGMVIYWFYGRTHSPLANQAEAAARTSASRTWRTS